MPSLETYKKMLASTGNTIGQAHKTNSDMIMEATWNRDIQSKVGYIYDYYHDDNPLQRKGFTYENTRKTKIDVKHIYLQSNSMVKDSPEMFLQFKPSQKMSDFSESDDLYYYQTDFYERYFAEFPVGLFVDLPNEKGIYERYLICKTDDKNQFVKHLILKCDYLFQFIEENGNQRIKRQMWGCTRSQSSYVCALHMGNHMSKIL